MTSDRADSVELSVAHGNFVNEIVVSLLEEGTLSKEGFTEIDDQSSDKISIKETKEGIDGDIEGSNASVSENGIKKENESQPSGKCEIDTDHIMTKKNLEKFKGLEKQMHQGDNSENPCQKSSYTGKKWEVKSTTGAQRPQDVPQCILGEVVSSEPKKVDIKEEIRIEEEKVKQKNLKLKEASFKPHEAFIENTNTELNVDSNKDEIEQVAIVDIVEETTADEQRDPVVLAMEIDQDTLPKEKEAHDDILGASKDNQELAENPVRISKDLKIGDSMNGETSHEDYTSDEVKHKPKHGFMRKLRNLCGVDNDAKERERIKKAQQGKKHENMNAEREEHKNEKRNDVACAANDEDIGKKENTEMMGRSLEKQNEGIALENAPEEEEIQDRDERKKSVEIQDDQKREEEKNQEKEQGVKESETVRSSSTGKNDEDQEEIEVTDSEKMPRSNDVKDERQASAEEECKTSAVEKNKDVGEKKENEQTEVEVADSGKMPPSNDVTDQSQASAEEECKTSAVEKNKVVGEKKENGQTEVEVADSGKMPPSNDVKDQSQASAEEECKTSAVEKNEEVGEKKESEETVKDFDKSKGNNSDAFPEKEN